MDKKEAIGILEHWGDYFKKTDGEAFVMAVEALKSAKQETPTEEQPQATPTGRVKLEDLSEFDYWLFKVDELGRAVYFEYTHEVHQRQALEQGNVFHDKASAEKEALKRKVLHKVYVEFGDDVCIYPEWQSSELNCNPIKGVRIDWKEDSIDQGAVYYFIKSLTEAEREAIS